MRIAGELGLQITPILPGFWKKAQAKLNSEKRPDVELPVEADTKKAAAKIDALRKGEQRNAVNLGVDADTAKATAELAAFRIRERANAVNLRLDIDNRSLRQVQDKIRYVEHTWKQSDIKRAVRVQVFVAGATALPALTQGLLSVTTAMTDLTRAGLALPGLFSGIAAAVATAATGISGVATALKEAANGMQKGEQYARQYATASRALERAQRDVVNALKDATREIEDQQTKLAQGQLSVEQAVLNVQKANERLAQGGFRTFTDYQQALLDVKQENLNLSVAIRQSKRDLDDYYDTSKKSATETDTFKNSLDGLANAVDNFRKAQFQAAGMSEQFISAMKMLSPAGQDFVLQLIKLRGAWTGLQNSVETTLFKGLGDSITNLVRTQLPMLKTGMEQVASSLNLSFKQLFTTLGSESNSNAIAKIFERTGQAIAAARPGIDSLVNAFLKLSEVGSRFLPRMANAFNLVMARFEAFVDRTERDGSLERWIDRGLDLIASLGRSLGSIGSIINSVTMAYEKATGNIGGFATTMERGLKGIADYFSSPKGQTALVEWVREAQTFMKTIKESLPGIGKIFRVIGDGARQFAEIVFPIFSEIGKFMGNHAEQVRTIVSLYLGYRTLKPFFSTITKGWNSAKGAGAQYLAERQAAAEAERAANNRVLRSQMALIRAEEARYRAASRSMQATVTAPSVVAQARNNYNSAKAVHGAAKAELAVATQISQLTLDRFNQYRRLGVATSDINRAWDSHTAALDRQKEAQKKANLTSADAVTAARTYRTTVIQTDREIASSRAGLSIANKNLLIATDDLNASQKRLNDAAARSAGLNGPWARLRSVIGAGRGGGLAGSLGVLSTMFGRVITVIGTTATTAGFIYAVDQVTAAHQRASAAADAQRQSEEALANTLSKGTGSATSATLEENIRQLRDRINPSHPDDKNQNFDAVAILENQLKMTVPQIASLALPTQVREREAALAPADATIIAAVPGLDEWKQWGGRYRENGVDETVYGKALNGDKEALGKVQAARQAIKDSTAIGRYFPGGLDAAGKAGYAPEDLGGVTEKMPSNIRDLSRATGALRGVGDANVAAGQQEQRNVPVDQPGLNDRGRRAFGPFRIGAAGSKLLADGSLKIEVDAYPDDLVKGWTDGVRDRGISVERRYPNGAVITVDPQFAQEYLNPIRRAAGGSVWGAGTATSDSIPALLSNGEFVINARSAKLIGHDKLNKMNSITKLATGGLVGDAIEPPKLPYPIDSNGSLVGGAADSTNSTAGRAGGPIVTAPQTLPEAIGIPTQKGPLVGPAGGSVAPPISIEPPDQTLPDAIDKPTNRATSWRDILRGYLDIFSLYETPYGRRRAGEIYGSEAKTDNAQPGGDDNYDYPVSQLPPDNDPVPILPKPTNRNRDLPKRDTPVDSSPYERPIDHGGGQDRTTHGGGATPGPSGPTSIPFRPGGPGIPVGPGGVELPAGPAGGIGGKIGPSGALYIPRWGGSGALADTESTKASASDAAVINPNANILDYLKQVAISYGLTAGSGPPDTDDGRRIAQELGIDTHGAPDGGQHDVNRAMDLGNPEQAKNGSIAAFVKDWMKDPSRVAATRQLIYFDPTTQQGYGIINGRILTGSELDNVYGKGGDGSLFSHQDHVHLALEGVPTTAFSSDTGTTPAPNAPAPPAPPPGPAIGAPPPPPGPAAGIEDPFTAALRNIGLAILKAIFGFFGIDISGIIDAFGGLAATQGQGQGVEEQIPQPDPQILQGMDEEIARQEQAGNKAMADALRKSKDDYLKQYTDAARKANSDRLAQYYESIGRPDLAEAVRRGDAKAPAVSIPVAPSAMSTPMDPNAPSFLSAIGAASIDQSKDWPNRQSRSGVKPDLFLIHTSEGADGQALVDYMRGNKVSYNYVVDLDGKTVRTLVPPEEAAWSVGGANNRSINIAIGGSWASWTREQWLSNAGNAIRTMAAVAANDTSRFGIPPNVIKPGQSGSGIGGHDYAASLGFTDHTDPGPNFPWDVFQKYVTEFRSGRVPQFSRGGLVGAIRRFSDGGGVNPRLEPIDPAAWIRNMYLDYGGALPMVGPNGDVYFTSPIKNAMGGLIRGFSDGGNVWYQPIDPWDIISHAVEEYGPSRTWIANNGQVQVSHPIKNAQGGLIRKFSDGGPTFDRFNEEATALDILQEYGNAITFVDNNGKLHSHHPINNARGGHVRGPGTETSDSIPALLSDGEFVMRAAAVKHWGVDRLEAMNAAPGRFANGGLAAAGGQWRDVPDDPFDAVDDWVKIMPPQLDGRDAWIGAEPNPWAQDYQIGIARPPGFAPGGPVSSDQWPWLGNGDPNYTSQPMLAPIVLDNPGIAATQQAAVDSSKRGLDAAQAAASRGAVGNYTGTGATSDASGRQLGEAVFKARAEWMKNAQLLSDINRALVETRSGLPMPIGQIPENIGVQSYQDPTQWQRTTKAISDITSPSWYLGKAGINLSDNANLDPLNLIPGRGLMEAITGVRVNTPDFMVNSPKSLADFFAIPDLYDPWMWLRNWSESTALQRAMAIAMFGSFIPIPGAKIFKGNKVKGIELPDGASPSMWEDADWPGFPLSADLDQGRWYSVFPQFGGTPDEVAAKIQQQLSAASAAGRIARGGGWLTSLRGMRLPGDTTGDQPPLPNRFYASSFFEESMIDDPAKLSSRSGFFTEEELRVLREYTGYPHVNSVLRRADSSGDKLLDYLEMPGGIGMLKSIFRDSEIMRSAMSRQGGISQDFVVTRFGNADMFPGAEAVFSGGLQSWDMDAIREALIGKTFLDPGFMSAALGRGYIPTRGVGSISGPIGLVYPVPAGSRAVYVSGGPSEHLSGFGSQENELISDTGGQYMPFRIEPADPNDPSKGIYVMAEYSQPVAPAYPRFGVPNLDDLVQMNKFSELAKKIGITPEDLAARLGIPMPGRPVIDLGSLDSSGAGLTIPPPPGGLPPVPKVKKPKEGNISDLPTGDALDKKYSSFYEALTGSTGPADPAAYEAWKAKGGAKPDKNSNYDSIGDWEELGPFGDSMPAGDWQVDLAPGMQYTGDNGIKIVMGPGGPGTFGYVPSSSSDDAIMLAYQADKALKEMFENKGKQDTAKDYQRFLDISNATAYEGVLTDLLDGNMSNIPMSLSGNTADGIRGLYGNIAEAILGAPLYDFGFMGQDATFWYNEVKRQFTQGAHQVFGMPEEWWDWKFSMPTPSASYSHLNDAERYMIDDFAEMHPTLLESLGEMSPSEIALFSMLYPTAKSIGMLPSDSLGKSFGLASNIGEWWRQAIEKYGDSFNVESVMYNELFDPVESAAIKASKALPHGYAGDKSNPIKAKYSALDTGYKLYGGWIGPAGSFDGVVHTGDQQDAIDLAIGAQQAIGKAYGSGLVFPEFKGPNQSYDKYLQSLDLLELMPYSVDKGFITDLDKRAIENTAAQNLWDHRGELTESILTSLGFFAEDGVGITLAGKSSKFWLDEIRGHFDAGNETLFGLPRGWWDTKINRSLEGGQEFSPINSAEVYMINRFAAPQTGAYPKPANLGPENMTTEEFELFSLLWPQASAAGLTNTGDYAAAEFWWEKIKQYADGFGVDKKKFWDDTFGGTLPLGAGKGGAWVPPASGYDLDLPDLITPDNPAWGLPSTPKWKQKEPAAVDQMGVGQYQHYMKNADFAMWWDSLSPEEVQSYVFYPKGSQMGDLDAVDSSYAAFQAHMEAKGKSGELEPVYAQDPGEVYVEYAKKGYVDPNVVSPDDFALLMETFPGVIQDLTQTEIRILTDIIGAAKNGPDEFAALGVDAMGLGVAPSKSWWEQNVAGGIVQSIDDGIAGMGKGDPVLDAQYGIPQWTKEIMDTLFPPGPNSFYASGGFVSGPGTSTSDSIPALLSDGEYVMNAKAVKHWGLGRLNAMNSIQRFNVGGPVGIPLPLPLPIKKPEDIALAANPSPLPDPGAAGAPTGSGGTAMDINTPEGKRVLAEQASIKALTQGWFTPKGGGGGGSAMARSPRTKDPRSQIAAPPSGAPHINPALAAGIRGAFDTAGTLANTAVQLGMAAGTSGMSAAIPGGSQAIGSLIQAGAKFAGDLAVGGANVVSSLLVGTVTPAETGQGYGAPLLPAQQPSPVNNFQSIHNGNIMTNNLNEYSRLKDRKDAQKSAPFFNRVNA